MAQQSTRSENLRQLQKNIKESAIQSESPTHQSDTNMLSEYHPLECQCPKHLFSDHALTQASQVSQDMVEQQQVEVSQAVYRGLEKLGLQLSKSEAERIGKNKSGMMPMERFLADEYNCTYAAGVDGAAEGEDGKASKT